MSVDFEPVHAETETFEDGQGKHEELEVVKGVLETFVRAFFCNIEHVEVNVQLADTLDVVDPQERVNRCVITAGVVLVYPHPRCPLVAYTCAVRVVAVIAVFQVQMQGQGNFSTPLQARGNEILVVVLHENCGPYVRG